MTAKIKVTDIKKAYKVTGFEDVCRCNLQQIGDGEGKSVEACPMVTLYASKHPTILDRYQKERISDNDLSNRAFKWADKTFGKKYVKGFIDGVDGNEIAPFAEGFYTQGFKEGKKVAKSLWGD